MIKNEHKYSDLTAKIIGCAMRVHSALGNGFQEVIYQRATAFALDVPLITADNGFDHLNGTLLNVLKVI